jgi:hypothetical protein
VCGSKRSPDRLNRAIRDVLSVDLGNLPERALLIVLRACRDSFSPLSSRSIRANSGSDASIASPAPLDLRARLSDLRNTVVPSSAVTTSIDASAAIVSTQFSRSTAR